jgi:hypothetical protein
MITVKAIDELFAVDVADVLRAGVPQMHVAVDNE